LPAIPGELAHRNKHDIQLAHRNKHNIQANCDTPAGVACPYQQQQPAGDPLLLPPAANCLGSFLSPSMAVDLRALQAPVLLLLSLVQHQSHPVLLLLLLVQMPQKQKPPWAVGKSLHVCFAC
jgi:hypothetical protein